MGEIKSDVAEINFVDGDNKRICVHRRVPTIEIKSKL